MAKKKKLASLAERRQQEERKAKKMAKLLAPSKGACRFTAAKAERIDYKDIETLGKMVSGQAKIQSRKRTGNSAFWQRKISEAVKRARFMALLPYTTN